MTMRIAVSIPVCHTIVATPLSSRTLLELALLCLGEAGGRRWAEGVPPDGAGDGAGPCRPHAPKGRHVGGRARPACRDAPKGRHVGVGNVR